MHGLSLLAVVRWCAAVCSTWGGARESGPDDRERQERPGPRPYPASSVLPDARFRSFRHLPPPPPTPSPLHPRFYSQTGELARHAPASPTAACLRPSPSPPARWSCLLPPARFAAGGCSPRPLAAAAAPTPGAPPPRPSTLLPHAHPKLATGTATLSGDTCSPASGRSTLFLRPA